MRAISMAVALSAVLGCGSGEEANNASSNNTFVRRSITGTVPRPAGVSALVSDASQLTRATEVWAIPVVRGAWERNLFTSIKRIPLADDGSFTFDATGETVDHILALVDADQCVVDKPRNTWDETDVDRRMDCVLGFVSMTSSGDAPQADDESLVSIPTSTQAGDLALGVLQGDASNPVLARSSVGFTDALDTLQQTEADLHTTAILDDGSVAAIWAWANGTDDQTAFYDMRAWYSWTASAPNLIAGLAGSRVAVDALTPSEMTLHVETNVDAATLSTAAMRLIPPAAVESSQGEVFTPEHPLEGARFGQPRVEDTTGYWNVPLGARLAVPPGAWVLERDGQFAAKADLSMGAPYRGVEGPADPWLPTVMVPELIVDGDETHLSRVAVRLWQHDGKSWQPVSIEAVAPAMGRPYIGVEGWNCPQMRMATISDERLLVEGEGSDAVYYGVLSAEEGALQGDCHVDEITFNYQFGGAQMGFAWRNAEVPNRPVSVWRAPGDAVAWLVDTELPTLGNAIGESFDCAELFEDVSPLGGAATCSRLSASRLKVSVGDDATLKPYDHLQLKNAALTWVDGSPVAGSDVEVWPRRDAPRVRLDGFSTTNTEVTACEVFDLTAEVPEGEDYTFDWTMEWQDAAVGDPGPALPAQLAEFLAQAQGPHIGLPLLLVPMGTWNVVLDAYNADGWRERVVTGLFREQYYFFETLPNWEFMVANGAAFYELPLRRACDAGEAETWAWEVDGQFFSQSQDNMWLITQGAMTPGTHTVTATVTRGAEVASTQRTLNVAPNTLTTVASVFGQTSVAAGSSVELRNLQAYLASDATQTDVPHQTYWFCFDPMGQPCAQQPPANTVTTLDTTGFAPGSYTVWAHAVSLDATNGGTATVEFEILP